MFTRHNDIYSRTTIEDETRWSKKLTRRTQNCSAVEALEVLEELPSVASIRLGSIRTLGREVVEFLEVGVHHNLLLVHVFERFVARQTSLGSGHDRHTATQAPDVTAEHCSKLRVGQSSSIDKGTYSSSAPFRQCRQHCAR